MKGKANILGLFDSLTLSDLAHHSTPILDCGLIDGRGLTQPSLAWGGCKCQDAAVGTHDAS